MNEALPLAGDDRAPARGRVGMEVPEISLTPDLNHG